MKKEERSVYIALSSEISGSLCTFCNYGDWVEDGCCEGYAECTHPIEGLSTCNRLEEGLEPGDDCYGFRANLPTDVMADLVGAILTEGWDEWFYRRFSRRSVTVYGRSFSKDGEISGKVRIG